MPLYEVVLEGTYFNQQVVNVFNYVSEGVPAAVNGSLLLLRGMGFIPDNAVYPEGTVFAAMRAVQSTSVSYTAVSSRDVYGTTDFWENPYVVNPAGQLTGEALSPTQAYGLRTSRVRSDIRRGQKRLVGVTETSNNAGGTIAAASLTLLQTLAARMSATLTVDDSGNTVTFVPCVVSKECYDPATQQPSPTGTAYRYYPTEEEQLEHIATGILWDPYTTVRTQNSRQYGVGR